MANNCYYQAHVVGSAQNVHELIKMMRWEDKYEHDGLGRIFSVDIIDESSFGNMVEMILEGDCAWSVWSGMIKCASKRNLISETKALGLSFEVYSEELGVGFQEHIAIDRGEIEVNDEVDCLAYDLDELDPEEIDDICKQNHLNKDEWLETSDDGRLIVGGFSGWIFSDPLEIVNLETKD